MSSKPAPNSPCPCGSGKKFKKCCKDAIRQAAPPSFDIPKTLAVALSCFQKGDLEEASRLYGEVLKLDPQNADSLVWMGVIAYKSGMADAGISLIERAIVIRPTSLDFYNVIITILQNIGEHDKALDWRRRGINIRFDETPSNAVSKIEKTRLEWLLAITIAPTSSNETILHDCRTWLSNSHLGKIEVEPLKPALQKGGPLRIGYLSSFLHHENYYRSLYCFFTDFDEIHFEVYVYNFGEPSRALENGCRAEIRDFRNTDATEAIRQIRQDGIDILVDLNAFADVCTVELLCHRIAPIQIILGNIFNTSGIPTVDYLIACESYVSQGEDEFYSETIVQIPDGCISISLPSDAPAVSAPPYLNNGYFTFGCFSSEHKINKAVVELWAKVLRACPNSRFMLKAPSNIQRPFANIMEKQGIDLDRLIMEVPTGYHQYLESYAKVDLVLDTFPYNGSTTTMEALGMGVPVITLYGDRWIGRLATAILRSIGMGDLVADSHEAYLNMACKFYKQPELAGDLRSILRQKIIDSQSATEKPSFLLEVEAAYQRLWRHHCEKLRATCQS